MPLSATSDGVGNVWSAVGVILARVLESMKFMRRGLAAPFVFAISLLVRQ